MGSHILKNYFFFAKSRYSSFEKHTYFESGNVWLSITGTTWYIRQSFYFHFVTFSRALIQFITLHMLLLFLLQFLNNSLFSDTRKAILFAVFDLTFVFFAIYFLNLEIIKSSKSTYDL
jgi:hypothetical protein